MEKLYAPEYAWLWALALAVALFYPMRQLLWTLYVRRAERDGSQDEARREALKRRAAVTSALLGFVFAVLYTYHLFRTR